MADQHSCLLEPQSVAVTRDNSNGRSRRLHQSTKHITGGTKPGGLHIYDGTQQRSQSTEGYGWGEEVILATSGDEGTGARPTLTLPRRERELSMALPCIPQHLSYKRDGC